MREYVDDGISARLLCEWWPAAYDDDGYWDVPTCQLASRDYGYQRLTAWKTSARLGLPGYLGSTRWGSLVCITSNLHIHHQPRTEV